MIFDKIIRKSDLLSSCLSVSNRAQTTERISSNLFIRGLFKDFLIAQILQWGMIWQLINDEVELILQKAVVA